MAKQHEATAVSPPSRLGKGPTPSSWKPGVSGNPGGRPRKALAAVDAVRDRVDPAEWVEAELAIARDLEKPWDVRRDAWRALIDRGFVRSPQQLDARISQDNASERDWSGIPIEKLRELNEMFDGAPMAPERHDEQTTVATPSDVEHIADEPMVPRIIEGSK